MQKSNDDTSQKKKTRRARNEGSVRWIEEKQLWQARYPIGLKETIDKNGKPCCKTVYKSIYGKKKTGPGGVMAEMRNALAALGKGTYIDPSDKTLIVWCQEWYETYKEPKLKTNTRLKYETSITRLKRYSIADMQLKNLSLELIQKDYNRMAKDGLSEETIKATHSLVNGALEKAEALNKINKNPARHVTIPRTDEDDAEESNTKALNDTQLDAFLYQIGRRSKYFMYAFFMLNTGLRPGEALALTRSDIDFTTNKIKVTKTYIEKLKKVQNSTKTASSRRKVPIPSEMISLLKEYMLQQPKKEPTDPLFQTATGKRPSQGYLRKRFKYAGASAGCEWVNLHTMRHTFASRLFKKKVDIKVISELLGHKDVSTTYDIYVHFIDNIVEESVQVLNSDIPENLPTKSRKGEKKAKKVIDIKKVSSH
ncbi:tyrosine-type recombinase/integrase [Ruminiclostridium cellulolyticum]|uniref:Integrase family protein n=1 Tax=Ruminiclostridium cellulolyticum (strain ATCC 35319 / DSM 5812 / JCM 6584 / H10) TaxID=394503 RepID=B8I151_RUMCH|nr:site-specific integrase [Ruminiclostridium cellulolyticum]ACL77607.1 integrase family protein [Ruminiclostridium cellulolyticum H10]